MSQFITDVIEATRKYKSLRDEKFSLVEYIEYAILAGALECDQPRLLIELKQLIKDGVV